MDFTKPEILYFLFILVPVFIVFLVYFLWQKDIVSNKFNQDVFKIISPNYGYLIKITHFFIKCLALIFLIFALSGPRIGTKIQTVKREGVDIVFALDVSKSMLVEDIAPNRLLKSIQIISKSIDNLVADRIGIIVYAGQAYPLMPLSFDYSMAKLLLNTIDSDIVPSQGTDVSSAIYLADSFFNNQDRGKILFILSDGEDHEGNYDKEIKQLLESNTVICGINIGTESGGPIPLSVNGEISYKKDKKNNVVISQAKSKILSSLSSLSNGSFIKTRDTKDAVDFVLNNLTKIDKSVSEEQFYSDYEDQFQWFLALALLFILIDLILTKKKINFIDKIIE